MHTLKAKMHRLYLKKVLVIVLFMDGWAIFIGEMNLLLRASVLAWSVLWLATNLSWRILLDENEIKDGRKIPWGPFLVRRTLLFSEVGYVCTNGVGSVILFKKSENKCPGKKEVVISHNLKGFEVVLREVIEKVDPSCVDDNVHLLLEKRGQKRGQAGAKGRS